MRPSVTYTPCDISSGEQTGNIITLAYLEEENILTKTCNNEESGDKYDDDSIMPSLLGEEDMGAMISVNESDHDPVSTEMLEDIHDGN